MSIGRPLAAITETGATAIWVGAAAGFAFVAGPVNFRTIADRNIIAKLTEGNLSKIARWVYVGGGLATAIAFVRSRAEDENAANDTARALAGLAAIAAIAYHQRSIVPRMVDLQTQIGRFDETPEDDPRRVAYRALHKTSTRWYGAALLCGLTQLALGAVRRTAAGRDSDQMTVVATTHAPVASTAAP